MGKTSIQKKLETISHINLIEETIWNIYRGTEEFTIKNFNFIKNEINLIRKLNK